MNTRTLFFKLAMNGISNIIIAAITIKEIAPKDRYHLFFPKETMKIPINVTADVNKKTFDPVDAPHKKAIMPTMEAKILNT